MTAGDPTEATRPRLFAFERNAVVRAGAGTGKTEALATVYLHLVGGLGSPAVWPRGGVPPERIVALTFTEKAAREMRERIAEAVDLLAADRLPRELESLDDGERRRAAVRWGGQRGLSAAVVARVTSLADSAVRHGRPLPGPEVWQRIAWSLGGARIGTFHGFAAGVLRRAAGDLGVDPAFTVIEHEDAERLLRGAALGALAAAAQHDVAAVVELMAAAGGIGERAERGLVTVIAGLVRTLDEDGLRADGLQVRAAVEPSDTRTWAASEVLSRFAEACETVAPLRADGTAGRVGELARVVEDFPALDSPERALERMRTLRGLDGTLPGRHRTRKLEPLAEEAREAVRALLQDAVAVVSARLAEVARGVVADTQRRYERAKSQRAALDFADLMRRLRDGLRDRTSLRREWKARFDAVLVDEFQDTNRVQRDLLYLLRERRDVERPLAPGQTLTAGELEPTGLLVVGDAKQSIYAFRGAEVAVFLATERELSAAGGERLELTDSFRAVDTLVAAVNPVTEALLGGVTAEGLYDRARDALTAVATGDGRVRAELLLVTDGRADTRRRAEAEAIARRITELAVEPALAPAPGTATATGAGDLAWRAPRMDEIAILVPSWSHLEPIKRALKARGIPYALRGGPGFWDRREVDDLVVLLRFVADPSDRLSLAAVLRGPLVGLTDAGLGHLFARSAGLEDLLDPPAGLRAALCAEDRARLDEARPALRRLVRFGPSLGPCGVLRQALAERAFAAVLAGMPFGAQRVANVDKLLGIAAAAEQRGGDEADLGGFVQYVDRMREAAQRESEADLEEAATGSVQVMSIHAAKGLEWPVVFVAQTARRPVARADRVLLDADRRLVVLPGGVDAPDAFRALRKGAHAAEDDDARRLLYVALTRARDLLVVTGPEEDGEGEWPLLRDALRREAPSRVRVAAPGDVLPPVPVRARAEALGPAIPIAEVEAAVEPVVAAAVGPGGVSEAVRPRRRLALAGEALQDFGWCPRRFHARHELGLREHGAAASEALAGAEIVRRVLAVVDLAALAREPEAAFARACAAAGARALGASADAAALAVRRFADSAVGAAVAADPTVVMARGLAYAVALADGDAEAVVTGRVDLVLRGEALGMRGVVVLRYGLPPARDDRAYAAPDAEVELELARHALARRLAEAGEAVEVHAAVLSLGERGGIEWVRSPREPGMAERVGEVVRGIHRARAEGRWEGRARYACEALGCGFIPRCHG